MGQHWYDGLAGRVLLTGAILFSPGCETATRRGDVYIPPSAGRVYADDTPAQASPPKEEAKSEPTLEEITRIVENAKNVKEVISDKITQLIPPKDGTQIDLYKMLRDSGKEKALVFIYTEEPPIDYSVRDIITANELAKDGDIAVFALSRDYFNSCPTIGKDYVAKKYPNGKTVGFPSVFFYTKGDPFKETTSWELRDVRRGGPERDDAVPPILKNSRLWFSWDYDKPDDAKKKGNIVLYENTFEMHKVPLTEIVKR